MKPEELVNHFKDHWANSANFDQYPDLVFKSAELLIPQLIEVVKAGSNHQMKVMKNTDFHSEHHLRLQKILNRYGSDKATRHGYHLFYCFMLEQLGLERDIRFFEIGLGTNNPALVSTMGVNGRPGASLRAFKEFLPNGKIYGADVDKDILFTEDRIQTSYVDQLDANTFKQLEFAEKTFDVIIDDGLHSIGANLNTLLFGLSHVSPGGWIVIEDIKKNLKLFWNIIDQILTMNPTYQTCFVECPRQCLYVVHRNKTAFD